MEICIEFKGVAYIANVDYTPGTEDEYYDQHGEPGTPGDPAEIEINSMHFINESCDIKEVLDSILTQDQWNEIEQLIYTEIEKL